jgi:hypothetical protein
LITYNLPLFPTALGGFCAAETYPQKPIVYHLELYTKNAEKSTQTQTKPLPKTRRKIQHFARKKQLEARPLQATLVIPLGMTDWTEGVRKWK